MPHLFVRFTMSLLPHRICFWFCHFHLLSVSVQLKSPLFLTASLVILYHLLFISLFLTETCDYFSPSQWFLSITLFLSISISLYSTKKFFVCHYFSLDLLSLLPPLSLSFSHYCSLLYPIQFLFVSLSLPNSYLGCFILHLPLCISISPFCAVPHSSFLYLNYSLYLPISHYLDLIHLKT